MKKSKQIKLKTDVSIKVNSKQEAEDVLEELSRVEGLETNDEWNVHVLEIPESNQDWHIIIYSDGDIEIHVHDGFNITVFSSFVEFKQHFKL